MIDDTRGLGLCVVHALSVLCVGRVIGIARRLRVALVRHMYAHKHRRRRESETARLNSVSSRSDELSCRSDERGSSADLTLSTRDSACSLHSVELGRDSACTSSHDVEAPPATGASDVSRALAPSHRHAHNLPAVPNPSSQAAYHLGGDSSRCYFA